MKKQYRRERIVFQAIVLGAQTKEEAAHIANGERFKRNLFMVGNMCRTNMTKLSESTSVFTATNVYYIDDLSFLQLIRHLLCKFRAAALRKMGLSEFVIVIVSDTGF